MEKLKEVHVRWIGIPLLAVIASMTDPEHLIDRTWGVNLFHSLCFTAVYWNGCFLIIRFFRKKYPDISLTKKRLLNTAFLIIIWLSVAGIPIKRFVQNESWETILSWNEHISFLPFSFVAATVVTLTYEAFYFFTKWKEVFRLNEDLKNRQIRTQYEVLQNQMSPHFLFNSLNTLTTIIAEDQNSAITFTEKLSEVYRYILQNKERELVTLKEEIEFVQSYLFLLRMRFPDNLKSNFNIDQKYESLNIPPLTIQMLVENAIKHNVVSKSKPLHIDLYVENGKSIVVKNNLQKKESLEKSTKTGLENIKKRYALLGEKTIDIITSANNYMVAVPLINLLEEKDLNQLAISN
ncbi:MAG: histidine kinase [Bacteroidota bacterium]